MGPVGLASGANIAPPSGHTRYGADLVQQLRAADEARTDAQAAATDLARERDHLRARCVALTEQLRAAADAEGDTHADAAEALQAQVAAARMQRRLEAEVATMRAASEAQAAEVRAAAAELVNVGHVTDCGVLACPFIPGISPDVRPDWLESQA